MMNKCTQYDIVFYLNLLFWHVCVLGEINCSSNMIQFLIRLDLFQMEKKTHWLHVSGTCFVKFKNKLKIILSEITADYDIIKRRVAYFLKWYMWPLIFSELKWWNKGTFFITRNNVARGLFCLKLWWTVCPMCTLFPFLYINYLYKTDQSSPKEKNQSTCILDYTFIKYSAITYKV